MREVIFHDSVIEQIDTAIAAFRPERGGILLGPIGVPVVSQFIADPDAAATNVTYTPSRQVGLRVAEAERAGTVEVKGIIHSHPGQMDHPSSGDHRSFANWMARMPWIPFLVTPIVTVGEYARGGEAHKVTLTNGEMSVFVAESRPGNAIQEMTAAPRILNITGAVADIASALRATASDGPVTYVSVEGHPLAATSLRGEDGEMITVLLPYTFPLHAPLILVPDLGQGGASTGPFALPLAWDLNLPDHERLGRALYPFRRSGSTTSIDAKAVAASVHEGQHDGQSLRDGIRARLEGALSESIRDATVLVVGLGSGGSQTVEALTRSSVEKFVVIDMDDVEPANLSRSTYDAEDVGCSKAAAVARRARAINPGVSVEEYRKALNDFSASELRELIDRVDMVVASTDDPSAQYRLNHVAWQAGRPAVFTGVYGGGAAGEVIFTIPDVTTCFRCATGGQRGAAHRAAEVNYGTGRLVAEPALGVDISHVVSTSMKVILGVMELSYPEAQRNSSAAMVLGAAALGQNFLQMSMVPEYSYFPEIFKDVPGQYAYQSVWLKTQSNPDCPTCGMYPVEDRFAKPVNLAALVPVDDPLPSGAARPCPREDILRADRMLGESSVGEVSANPGRIVER